MGTATMREGDTNQTSAQRQAAAARHVEEHRHKEKPLAPAYLTAGATAVWYEIMDAVLADHFQPEDHRALAAYCEACALLERMASDADTEPFTVTDDHGVVKVNPFHTLFKNTTSSIAGLAMRLKLVPSTRTKEGAGTKAARRMLGAGQTTGREGLMFQGKKQ